MNKSICMCMCSNELVKNVMHFCGYIVYSGYHFRRYTSIISLIFKFIVSKRLFCTPCTWSCINECKLVNSSELWWLSDSIQRNLNNYTTVDITIKYYVPWNILLFFSFCNNLLWGIEGLATLSVLFGKCSLKVNSWIQWQCCVRILCFQKTPMECLRNHLWEI